MALPAIVARNLTKRFGELEDVFLKLAGRSLQE